MGNSSLQFVWAVAMTTATGLLAGGCAIQKPVASASSEAAASRTVLVMVDDRPLQSSVPAAAQSVVRQPATTPASIPADAPDGAKAAAAFDIVAKGLGRTGVHKTPAVYVVMVPRDDLTIAIEGMEVPTAAGVESIFNFYQCPCGKTNVTGQFCVLDYEVNDVIDALRAGHIEITSIAPMLLHARQAPVLIRFYAEGAPDSLAKTIREALRWTGKERYPAVPFPLSRPATSDGVSER